MKHTLFCICVYSLISFAAINSLRADEGEAPEQSTEEEAPDEGKPASDPPKPVKSSGDKTQSKDKSDAERKIIFTIQLVDGSKLIGPPVDMKELSIKADFGPISIPLNLVSYATFSKDHQSLAIKFRNNDLLTGKPTFAKVAIRTAFGQAAIPVARIAKLSIAEPFK